jgi:transposase-like protein
MKRTEQALRAKYLAIFREREKDNKQSVSAFCKKQGISPAAYYRWKNILRPTRLHVPQESFVPVTVAPSSDNIRQRYDLRFPNGATLQITGGLNSADLSALVVSIGKLAP